MLVRSLRQSAVESKLGLVQVQKEKGGSGNRKNARAILFSKKSREKYFKTK